MASSTVSSCVLSWRWPAVTMIETERGGYGYPSMSPRSSLALPGLPSGRERHRDWISACAIQVTEHGAKSQGVVVLCTDRALLQSALPRSYPYPRKSRYSRL